MVSRLDRAECPAASEFLGPDREVRRCDGPGQHVFRIGALPRQVDVDPVAFLRAATEERHAMGMVPVQVTEQYRTPERCAAQRKRQLLQTRSGIEYQGRRLVAVCQPYTGGMTSVVCLACPAHRRGAARAAEVGTHDARTA